MVHIVKRICIFVLLASLIVAFRWTRFLPLSADDALNRSQNAWCGVLRMWVLEGWEAGSGSLVPWLTAASQAFERAHDGVYVQVTPVSRELMRSFNYAAKNPPDLILFYPGALDTPDDLLKTNAGAELTTRFGECGDGFALPVAMGGYALIEAGDAESAPIFMPEDTDALSYSAAAAALLIGDSIADDGSIESGTGYGIDLGLPARTRAPVTYARREIVPVPGSGRADNAYSLFSRGEIRQTVVTQREIRKLQLLDDEGRAPDWHIRTTGETFTDQLALVGIVDIPRDDLQARQMLSVAFREFLLSDAQQAALSKVRAFRVTEGSALYAGQRGLSEMEAALTENRLILPDAFASGWRTRAADAADALLKGEGGAAERIRELFPQSE